MQMTYKKVEMGVSAPPQFRRRKSPHAQKRLCISIWANLKRRGGMMARLRRHEHAASKYCGENNLPAAYSGMPQKKRVTLFAHVRRWGNLENDVNGRQAWASSKNDALRGWRLPRSRRAGKNSSGKKI